MDAMSPPAAISVLFVDDEEALVALGRWALSKAGYAVTGFTDPEVALREFRARPGDFDVVVSDIGMPVLCGFDFVREVLATRADIPIVMLSGFVSPDDEESARQFGVRAVIRKPDSITELSRVLDGIFRGNAL
jgi:DNA-binding response OmpR family regulator